ncbi:MAG: TIGR04013 family B12-binding domain/radical SAM domain-containing protein, partial [Rubrobacteridae bacterium]|nr:TIGR04013 family B12-binding domain/radical SAM domain-containing protein [Rubrobacteridae bacterium]
KQAAEGKEFLLVAGGPHPSGDPFGTLKMGFDIVVIGEAEETFPELAVLFSKRDADVGQIFTEFEHIKGIAISSNNRVTKSAVANRNVLEGTISQGNLIKTGRRPYLDLNNYAPFSIKSGKLSPIEISRGCPHACRFCQTSFLFGNRMRHRNIDQILKYMRLSKENGTHDFRFISTNALAYGSKDGRSVNFDMIEILLEKTMAIAGKEHLFFGSFPSEVRPEAVTPKAIELITTYTGTKQIVIGAQSGSQRMLDILHREHTVEDVDTAVECVLEAGLKVSVDFIFGLPEENDDDRAMSIEKMNRLVEKGARIHSHTFIPLPGTPLANAAPGVIDKELAAYLGRLANRGLQFGQWKKQQKMALDSLSFMSGTT